MTDYLVANLGRLHPDRFQENLRVVRDATDDNTVLCLIEVDEYDKPEEMDSVLRLFDKTHWVVGDNLFNPILVPRRRRLARARQSPASKGMAHFTPHRTVNEVTIIGQGDGPDETVLSVHIPRMPPTASAAIQREVGALRVDARSRLRARAQARHEKGDAVTMLLDANDRRLSQMVKGEVPLFQAWPDCGRTVAPRGHRVDMGALVHEDLTIDGHDLEGRRSVRFPER